LVDFPYVLRLSHSGSTQFYTQQQNTLNRTARYSMTAVELRKKEVMLKYLKAYLQVYNNRLLDNKFY
ncbi:MAG: hypothetical protein H7321_01265, partial [Bacteroidia bacterium]|nr:hypothetical protein [Bacteroidia bacterium]